jgi:hypothetical protein
MFWNAMDCLWVSDMCKAFCASKGICEQEVNLQGFELVPDIQIVQVA